MLHPPQFAGSTPTFVHVKLQSVVPAGHLHCPPAHVVPLGQVVPQSPQWLASVMRSVHVPLQAS